MNEYIIKQALLDKTVKRNHAWLYTTNSEGKNLKEIVDELPPADVRPNIHAEWEKPTGKIQPFGEDTRQCTGCGFFTDKDGCYVYNFCPSCGAIMDGEPKTTVKVEIKGEPIPKTIADMREPKGEKKET